MAVFDAKSRYVKHAETYETVDQRGRTVTALIPAEPPAQTKLGDHRRRDGQRLDHLAFYYLDDPYAFWRLAELNDTMTPDVLAEADIVQIPTRL